MFKLTYLSRQTEMSYEVVSQNIEPLLRIIYAMSLNDYSSEYKIDII